MEGGPLRRRSNINLKLNNKNQYIEEEIILIYGL